MVYAEAKKPDTGGVLWVHSINQLFMATTLQKRRGRLAYLHCVSFFRTPLAGRKGTLIVRDFFLFWLAAVVFLFVMRTRCALWSFRGQRRFYLVAQALLNSMASWPFTHVCMYVAVDTFASYQ